MLGNPTESRRRILKAGLGATALFLPAPYAWVWAQSEGAMKLLRLPKVALVIGNSKYVRAPVLANPGNDAKGISDVLTQSGFDVTTRLDATLNDMNAAIQAYVQTLAMRKAIGLFYFAGHGVQLGWRNYVVPVDASVQRIESIQKSCVDLTGLVESMGKAANPMNLVILDACRDNPFGGDIRVENRGLSQMDAPHSTLLAYATAPGNVAGDGDGANGIYTENLLREMRVSGAKIEDVFKRVRLHVRRRTNGQQVPWESTSLEEDFYFVPPKPLGVAGNQNTESMLRHASAGVEGAEFAHRPYRVSPAQLPFADVDVPANREWMLNKVQPAMDALRHASGDWVTLLAERDDNPNLRLAQLEKGRSRREPERRRDAAPAEGVPSVEELVDRQFEEERAMWESIQSSRDPSRLEESLLRYPSGRFSELTQLFYDRLMASRGEKRIEIINDARNPYTKGSATANIQFKPGDSYTYRRSDMITKLDEGSFTETITGITDARINYDSGFVTDLLGNRLRGRTNDMGNQAVPLEFAVGRRWTSRYVMPPGKGASGASGSSVSFVDMDFRIITRESVTVPAGAFNAFHIRGHGWSVGVSGRTQLETTVNVWHAPGQVRRPVIVEHFRRAGKNIERSAREELVAFKES